MASLRHTTDQRVLRHTNRRKVESNTHVARDPEQCRMETAVTVNQEDVRSPIEATNSGLDSRKLAISEVCRDVRKIGVMAYGSNVNRIEILQVEACGHDVHRISFIACVDSGDTVELRTRILFDDAVAEDPLLFSQRAEKADGFQRVNDAFRRDTPTRELDTLSLEFR